MGLTKYVIGYSFWLVELVGEAFISDLELSSIVHLLVYLEGKIGRASCRERVLMSV